MVKVVCPVCGKMGILQVRGNSKRVQHYVGYKNENADTSITDSIYFQKHPQDPLP